MGGPGKGWALRQLPMLVATVWRNSLDMASPQEQISRKALLTSASQLGLTLKQGLLRSCLTDFSRFQLIKAKALAQKDKDSKFLEMIPPPSPRSNLGTPVSHIVLSLRTNESY